MDLRRRYPRRSGRSGVGPSRLLSASLPVAGVAAALLIVTLATPSAADEASLGDRRDNPDTRLDIRSIGHRHRSDGRLVHVIKTYRGFSSRILVQGRLLDMSVTPPASATTSFNIRWRRGALRVVLFRVYGPGDVRRIGVAKASRPNPRTVKVVWARRFLKVDPDDHDEAVPTRYRWDATSIDWIDPRCEPIDGGCGDNTFPLRHDLTL